MHCKTDYLVNDLVFKLHALKYLIAVAFFTGVIKYCGITSTTLTIKELKA